MSELKERWRMASARAFDKAMATMLTTRKYVTAALTAVLIGMLVVVFTLVFAVALAARVGVLEKERGHLEESK